LLGPGTVEDVVRVLSSLVSLPSYVALGTLPRDRVALVSDKEGFRSLWLLDPSSRELRRLVDEPISFASRARSWVSRIVYGVDVAKGAELHKLFALDIDTGEKVEIDAPPARVLGLAHDDKSIAFTASTRSGVHLYLAKWDGSCEKLADINAIASVTDVNERYIAGFGILRGDPRSYELFFYDLRAGELRVYTPKPGSVNQGPILRGSLALFESNFEGRNRLYEYSIENGELRKVSFKHGDYDSFDPVSHRFYDYVGDSVYCVAMKNGRTRLFVDGKEIPTPRGCIAGFPAFLSDGSVVLTVSSLVKPPHVIRVSPDGSTEVLVENEIPKDVRDRIGEVRFVKYRSFDGLEIPMYVVESRSSPKPGRGVVYIHGGPWFEVADEWRVLIAALAACGYHVLAPNYRGSTGYGEEFRRLIIGDPGGGDLEDIVYAKKWGVENGLVKEGEVCSIGYSYGGYATLLALGKKPEEWKCGVAGAAVADWEEMYELSDAVFRKFIETLFAGKRELFSERSPITYVDKVKAPLCIIQPQNDSRTPLKPVLRYVSKLLELGKTFELHVAPDMGHVIRTMDDAVKILLPALLFLKRYLG